MMSISLDFALVKLPGCALRAVDSSETKCTHFFLTGIAILYYFHLSESTSINLEQGSCAHVG